MRPHWRRLPVRLRAVLAALGLLCALFLLWWLSGWAWPTQALAHRALEREHLFGPGELVGRGTVALSQETRPSQGTHFLVSRSGDRFCVSVLRPKWGLLWRSAEGALWPLFILSPTEEAPLAYSFLAYDTLTSFSDGQFRTAGSDYLLLVASRDPEIVRVEVTMGVTPLDTLRQNPQWLEEQGVTVSGAEVAPGLWTALLTLRGQTSGTTLVRLRGYDAAGALLFDSGPPEKG